MYEMNLRTPARVVVDPNTASRRDPDLIVAQLEHVAGAVREGAFVVAVEPDDEGGRDLVGSAYVSHVDQEHGLVYLHVDWSSFVEDTSQDVVFATSNGTQTLGWVRSKCRSVPSGETTVITNAPLGRPKLALT